MKKIYQNPAIEIINIKTSASLLEYSNPNPQVKPTDDPVDTNVLESRGGRGFWDDEEDF